VNLLLIRFIIRLLELLVCYWDLTIR